MMIRCFTDSHLQHIKMPRCTMASRLFPVTQLFSNPVWLILMAFLHCNLQFVLHSISFCQGLRPSEEEVARNARTHDDDADLFTLRHWNINYSTANSPDRFRYRINSGSQQQQKERRSAKINCSNTLDPCHIHFPLMHFRSRSARLRLAVRRGHVVSDQLSGICIFKKPTAHQLRVPFGSTSSIFSTGPGFQPTMRLTDKCTLCQERKVARQKKMGFTAHSCRIFLVVVN